MLNRGNWILASDAFRATVTRPNASHEAPSFVTIRQIATTKRSEIADKGADSNELIDALRSQLAAEKEQTEAGFQLAMQEQDLRKQIEAQLESERALIFRLKSKIEVLEAHQSSPAQNEVVPPDNYAKLGEWIDITYAGKVTLHPRAKKALKSAQYNNITHIIDGLNLLANEYRNMRLGICNKKEFEHRLSSLGFDESKSVSKSTAGKSGDQYFVSHSGEKHFLERHLKKGNSKNPALCLRIYYFFDENTEEVVVGYLPDHLDTLST